MDHFKKILSILTSRSRSDSREITKTPYVLTYKGNKCVVATDGQLLFLCEIKNAEKLYPSADGICGPLIELLASEYTNKKTKKISRDDLFIWADEGPTEHDYKPGFINDVLIDKLKLVELLSILNPCLITITTGDVYRKTDSRSAAEKVTFKSPAWTILLAPMFLDGFEPKELDASRKAAL